MVKAQNITTPVLLPEEYASRIESDLNKIAESLPDHLEKVFSDLYQNIPYSESYEFLVGWSIGNCEGSYIQGFTQVYEKFPSDEQISEIRKIISRRRLQPAAPAPTHDPLMSSPIGLHPNRTNWPAED